MQAVSFSRDSRPDENGGSFAQLKACVDDIYTLLHQYKSHEVEIYHSVIFFNINLTL
jgi:hypothetical protein